MRRLKAHPNYTTAIGDDLGIVRPHSAPNNLITPTFTAEVLPNSKVKINFKKKGFSGVYLESQRGNETGWSYLGTFISSPFEDSREPEVDNKPEKRTYRMRYLKGNNFFGQVSDTVTVSTLP